MHVRANAEVCVISNLAKDTPSWQVFVSILYLFDPIFPEIVLIDKPHHIVEGICLPSNGCHGKGKKNFHLSKQQLLWAKYVSLKTWIL